MTYEAKQAVYLPVADFLNLEFHLMDTRPVVKPDVFVTELVKRWLATFSWGRLLDPCRQLQGAV